MNIIKLSATNSTNDYLKTLAAERYVEHLTLVVAEHQLNGRGQRGAQWYAEPGKNLTFSILIKDLLLDINEIFYLNAAVAVSITDTLAHYLSDISIKWPNDILAGNYKIGGILIENSIKNNGEIVSVAGIGLNVNQHNFEGLPKATSMAVVAGHDFDKETIMLAIADNLKRNIAALMHNGSNALWEKYHDKLYRKGIPMPFEKEGQKFMGIIQEVSRTGNLKVTLEDDTTALFGLKEVRLLY
ncbi:biotin--[acetyl-CoA-carboxylase] ligase [Flavobacterium cyanobacteriorum]|uniref:Biotin--[acetyl-CoA-carboxylase] ligase n=1 Tax=Flavobacterium cyanobacteriorum TaxID=2022802 RepID=A0A255YTF2_9FLAO|nr:biotin--[acetyl-CoA-carboxylase] ligase [Flavobacterium cyanobacteriorum]OYQ31944.1 biotin--[acetyl-CoA-carboxylase] ligase [Flavobacterium cyanobacteriorum]